MSIVAEFVLGSPILMETFERVPGARAVLVREDVSQDRPARLTFWAVGADDAFEAAMADDWTVDGYTRLASTADRSLYRIDIAPELRERLTYDTVLAVDGIFISTVGDADGWHIRARFPDHDGLKTYHDACREAEFDFELERLYTTSDTDFSPSPRLTDPQREVLEVALERGYFDIPKSATTEDIGAELDISGQAVSERLRRALKSVAEAAVRGEL